MHAPRPPHGMPPHHYGEQPPPPFGMNPNHFPNPGMDKPPGPMQPGQMVSQIDTSFEYTLYIFMIIRSLE